MQDSTVFIVQSRVLIYFSRRLRRRGKEEDLGTPQTPAKGCALCTPACGSEGDAHCTLDSLYLIGLLNCVSWLEENKKCRIFVLSVGRTRLFIIVCMCKREKRLLSGLLLWLRHWLRLCFVSCCAWEHIHCL